MKTLLKRTQDVGLCSSFCHWFAKWVWSDCARGSAFLSSGLGSPAVLWSLSKEVAVPTAWEGSSSNGAWSGIDCASWRIFSSFIVGRSVLSLGPGLRWPPDLLFEVNTQTVNRVAQVGGWWGSGADLLGNLYFQIGLVILLPNSKFPPGGKRAAKVKLCEGKAEKEWNKRKIVSSLYLLNSSRAKGATSPGHPMYLVSLLTEAEWAGSWIPASGVEPHRSPLWCLWERAGMSIFVHIPSW